MPCVRPLLLASLSSALAACGLEEPPRAVAPNVAASPIASPTPPVWATTIRIDGQLWQAPATGDIVSALPLFVVRVEGAADLYQIVEEPGATCDTSALGVIAPAAARWRSVSDPDGTQTVTTGEGVRHFCAFRKSTSTGPLTPIPFAVTVAPDAHYPYAPTADALAEEPSVVSSFGLAGANGASIAVRFIAGFGVRNSGRWTSAIVPPPATDYDTAVVIPGAWDTSTVSFVPPSGDPQDLTRWEQFAIGYVKSATADEANVRLFESDVATRGFESLPTLMTKLGHLTPWQLYRLGSLFRTTENLRSDGLQWMGMLNGIPDWRAFRRWRDVLWTNVDGDPSGPRIYFGRTWIPVTPTPATLPLSSGNAALNQVNGMTLDPAGMAFWATFEFPLSPLGDRVENPFTRTQGLQEKAVRLALVTTFYQGLALARSIRLSDADALPGNDCRIDEYIGPQVKAMFKAIDTLSPLLQGPEFEGTVPALKAMTQHFLHHLDELPVAGGGGTNMCLPEVAAEYYAVHWNPADPHWRYLRDAREHDVYEHVYPGIAYHQHGSFSWEASYEGNANSHNVELCAVFGSPLACGKLYLSNRLKRDLMLAEPDYTEPAAPGSPTQVVRIGQFKGPSGTNTSTAEPASNDQGFAASRDQLTDQLFPGIFGYLVAHARRSFAIHVVDQSLSAYASLTDVDIARREIVESLTATADRVAYNAQPGHAGYFRVAAPGIEDWFRFAEAAVPLPADIYNPANYLCGSYAKIVADSLYRGTVETTETGAASATEVLVADLAQSTLAAPTVPRLPSVAYAARPGIVRFVMPRSDMVTLENTYLRFDAPTYSAAFYAGTTGWEQGVDYVDPSLAKTPSVRGFGPGLLSFSVFGTGANQTPVQRNLSGPVLLSESDGGQLSNDPSGNWLDHAEAFPHPAIVGVARPVGTVAGCAGRFTTIRQRYGGGTTVTETNVGGVLSTLAVNTRGFVNQELNRVVYNMNQSYQTNAQNNATLVAALKGQAPAAACGAGFPNNYVCQSARTPTNNMSYGAMEIVRPNDPITGNTCTDVPLPFTLEFNRNYTARMSRIDVTVNLKTPNPAALPIYTPRVFLKPIAGAPNVLFDQLDEAIPVYHDIRQSGAGTFDPDFVGSSKVWVRTLDAGGAWTAWMRLTWNPAGPNPAVTATQIFIARYAGGALIAFPSGPRAVRLTAPSPTKNYGTTQNLLVSLLPANPPALGYSAVYGSASALNLALTYQISPRTSAALP